MVLLSGLDTSAAKVVAISCPKPSTRALVYRTYFGGILRLAAGFRSNFSGRLHLSQASLRKKEASFVPRLLEILGSCDLSLGHQSLKLPSAGIGT